MTAETKAMTHWVCEKCGCEWNCVSERACPECGYYDVESLIEQRDDLLEACQAIWHFTGDDILDFVEGDPYQKALLKVKTAIAKATT